MKSTVRNQNHWGRLVLWPLWLDLCMIAVVAGTLAFGAVNAVQEINNYWPPHDGYYGNNPTQKQATAIFLLLNTLTPAFTLLLHSLHLLIYTRRTLNPIYTLTASSLMSPIWGVVLGWWLQFGAKGRWSDVSDRGNYVSDRVYSLMMVGGAGALALNLVYLAVSAKAISDRRKTSHVAAQLGHGPSLSVDDDKSPVLVREDAVPAFSSLSYGRSAYAPNHWDAASRYDGASVAVTEPPSYRDSATVVSSQADLSDRMTFMSMSMTGTTVSGKSVVGKADW